jgi:hypothetical protein
MIGLPETFVGELDVNCRDATVSKSAGFGLDSWCSTPGRGITFRPALVSTSSLIRWVHGVLSSVLKWPYHEADHSLVPRVEVKRVELYVYSPYVFIAQYLGAGRTLPLTFIFYYLEVI